MKMLFRPRSVFFLSFAALVSQVRFTSLLFRDFGMNDEEIGLSLGVGLVAGALMVPTWTRLADQNGSILVLKIIMIGHLFATLLYSFTPLIVPENRVWFTMFGRVCAMGFMQALSPVADAYALRRLAGSRALYGRERAWGSLSWGLAAVVLGGLMTLMNLSVAYQIFTAVLTAGTLFVLWNSPSDLTEVKETAYVKPDLEAQEQIFVIDDEDERDTQKMTPEEKLPGAIKPDPRVQTIEDDESAEATTTVKDKPKAGITIFLRTAELHTIVFLIVMLCLEMGQSLTESLEFLFIVEQLKSSPLLCGISVTVAVVLEVPLLFLSEPLLRRVGILALMLFGIFVFCIRITAFTFISSTNPWMILSVEPLAGVYVALVKMSSVSFMSQAAPRGMEAVAMGTMNVFRCMGQVFGTVIGSYILQHFGPTVLYRSFGILVTLAGFVLIWVIRRRNRALAVSAAVENSTTVRQGEDKRRKDSVSLAPIAARQSFAEVIRKQSVDVNLPEPKFSIGGDDSDVIKSEIGLLELHKT